MDDDRPQTASSRAFAQRVFVKVTLLLVVAVTGCLTPKAQVAPLPQPAAFATFSQAIAKFRGLQIRRELSLIPYAPVTIEIDSHGPFQLEQVQRVYRSLGLLPNNVDLAKALAEYQKLLQLVVYDATQGSVTLAPQAAQLDVLGDGAGDAVKAFNAPLAFAVVTALQEQNFQWSQKVSAVFLDDRRLAFRALAIGDALLTVIARVHQSLEAKLTAADLAASQQLAGNLDIAAARLPEFLRQKLTFPFREGIQFTYWALNAKGWPGVNALYGDPPLTTAQMLHPEKYFIKREPPQRFFPAALLGSMKDGTVVEQSLGEQIIGALLATSHNTDLARATAAAWRGDQLFSFQEGEYLTTAWYSSWTSAAAAAAFQRCYQTVLEKQQRVRFDSAGASSNRRDGMTRDGRAVTLQVKESVVLYLTGMPSNRFNNFNEVAWQDLEIDADSTAVGFDLAKRSTH